MSQDDQNRDPQDQTEGYKDQSTDDSSRQGRSESSPSDSAQPSQDSQPDRSSDSDEADDMDEDRDDDSRTDGSSNRRNNIG